MDYIWSYCLALFLFVYRENIIKQINVSVLCSCRFVRLKDRGIRVRIVIFQDL